MLSNGTREQGLRPGKIPPEILAALLSLPRTCPPEITVGPSPGEDAAVVTMPEGQWVVASDPITFITPRPGHFAVCVNVNDIAATGGTPLYYTLTLILPPGSMPEEVLNITRDAIETGDALGVTLVGGHTEVCDAVNRVVVSVTMIGRIGSRGALCTGGACHGDCLVQINPLAIEGTAILAGEQGDRFREQLGEDVLETATGLLENPGICILRPAELLASLEGVKALHDPTEGGIATGIREMAEASGLGVSVDRDQLLMLPVTEEISRCCNVDPLGLISSGCLIAAVDPDAVDGVLETMRRSGYAVAVIGEFREERECVLKLVSGEVIALPVFGADELVSSA